MFFCFRWEVHKKEVENERCLKKSNVATKLGFFIGAIIFVVVLWIMDISIIFKIAAIGILITVICQILKKSDREDIATLVSIAGLIIVLSLVVNMVGELFESLKSIFNLYG